MAVATRNRIADLVSSNGHGTNGHTKPPKAPKLSKADATAQRAEIPPPDIRMMAVKIVGDSPLICSRFSTKSIQEIADKQQGKAKQKKAPKDPKQCFKDSLYPMPGKKNAYGFPAAGFKMSAVSACRFVDGIPMSVAKGAFFIMGDFVEIKHKTLRMREDVVRVGKFGSKTADLRYRGEFTDWSCTVTIRYNARALTPEQIINLLNTAGFSIGIGEWRAEKSAGGTFGMYHVDRKEK